MKTRWMSAVLVSAVTLAVACDKPAEKTEAPAVEPAKVEAPKTPLELALANTALFQPLPKTFAHPDQTKEQEDLGRMLYYETRVSKNYDISCNSCHNLKTYGVDNQPTSPGHKGVRGGRNSPTSLNAAGHFAQFWDGREPDVEAQAKGPVLNPVEMAMPDPETVVNVLKSIPGYQPAFAAAFPDDADPINYDNFGKAVGAFERNLVTPSRWDKFLEGDHTALTEAELKGFNTFMASGCQACHNGALVGGGSFQKLGAVKPWPNQADHGRMDVTKNATDDLVFKAPSLRNIAKTGPYFHDGSVKDLTEAVAMMGEYQLGRKLNDQEAGEIVAWLNTLTGELDMNYAAQPELPESGPKTPAPDPS